MSKRTIESIFVKAIRAMQKSLQQERKCLEQKKEVTKALEELIEVFEGEEKVTKLK